MPLQDFSAASSLRPDRNPPSASALPGPCIPWAVPLHAGLQLPAVRETLSFPKMKSVYGITWADDPADGGEKH